MAFTLNQFEILEYLEPCHAKKALFLDAGFGSRMMPITLNTSKPLVLLYVNE